MDEVVNVIILMTPLGSCITFADCLSQAAFDALTFRHFLNRKKKIWVFRNSQRPIDPVVNGRT